MMKKYALALFAICLASPIFAGDFITRFLNQCVEGNRLVNNVNIGKTMLNKMIDITGDESLKTAFHDLRSIRLVTTENPSDSKFYFEKARDLASAEFGDYQEVVSVNEKRNKMSVLIREEGSDDQDIILILLDDNHNLTLITLSGKIDLASLSKLSTTLENRKMVGEDEKTEDAEDNLKNP
ncbi:MAG: DUF4252 domain-containing protein [Dysgonamonadaceae bacterium]|jgi:hypothetical protein|nr:DUF4252 domain-containing protein [Dysgonamonadaceae bacterium]